MAKKKRREPKAMLGARVDKRVLEHFQVRAEKTELTFSAYLNQRLVELRHVDALLAKLHDNHETILSIVYAFVQAQNKSTEPPNFVVHGEV